MDSNLKTTLTKFRQAYDTRLENGSLVPEKSQTAKNLLPVSSSSGSTQTAPFINQGTATNNNDSQAVVDTGTLGQHLEKQGNSVVVNNQIQDNFDTGTGWIESNVSVTFSNNQAHIVGTGNANGSIYKFGSDKIEGHKYLIMYEAKASANGNAGYGFAGTYKTTVFSVTTSWQLFTDIITASSTNSVEYVYYGVDDETLDVKNFVSIDLTQWFGSNDNIPADLLSHPENFFHYYNGSLAYNTGTLVNSNGRYLVNGGQNILNPEETYQQVIPNRGYIYKHSSGTSTTITYYDKDKNIIDTASISSATYPYENASFTTPSNCLYISSSVVANCMVCLFYDNENYDNVIPYEEPKVYDTGDEVLRSAGSVKDIKLPNGTITRNVGYVDLGSLSWAKESGFTNVWYTTGLSSIAKLPTLSSVSANIVSQKYLNISASDLDDTTPQSIALHSNGYLYVCDENSPTGTLFYELATPTTEQGTPFSENMDINDMGNMAWYSAYTDSNTNTLVSVPQGCKIFYPAWYVGFIDSLGQRADIEWSADNVVSQSELSASETQRDTVDTQLLNAVGGTLRHCLAIQESGIDFEDTDFVDLGTLNWSKSTVFYVPGFTQMSGDAGLCTKFKVITQSSSDINGTLQIRSSDKYIYFFYAGTEYENMTADQFKNSLKGVLLAYEKA